MTRPNFSVSIPGQMDVYDGTGTVYYPANSGPRATHVASETVSGVSRHKPQGFLDPTGYTMEHKTAVNATGQQRYYFLGFWPGYGTWLKGTVGGGAVGHSSSDHFNSALLESVVKDDAGLRNAALIAVRNRLKSTSINLGVAFGERNQTARLLGSNATRMANAVRRLRRGEIRRAMDELGISSRRRQPRGRNVPERWLELQYGWKPLLSDVYGAATALEKRPKGDWRVTAKVTKTRRDSYVYVKEPKQSSNFDAHRCEARLFRSVFARIDAIPQNEALISLASLGVTNPLSVAWELVPWSFVIDWALPIGSWLESLDALLGYGSTAYSSSFLAKANWKDRGLSGTFPTYGSAIENNFSATKRMVYLSRQVSTTVPLPSLPRFKDPRSLGHMANGLALLATAFGRR